MKKLIFIIALFGMVKANAQDWSLTGNAGTNPGTNFIGTTDNQSFAIRSKGVNRIWVDSTGKVGIGTSSPTAQFHFSGAKFILNSTSGTASSLIKIKGLLEIQNGAGTLAVFDGLNGRVGIGTTTPSTLLDVNGIISATGGNSINWNSAFGWGNHATAGYITLETDPQVGTITSGYIPKWNGSALVTGSIYDNASNVGIGITTLAAKLHVRQNTAGNITCKFESASGTNFSYIHFGAAGDWFIRSAANTGNIILQDNPITGGVQIGTVSTSAAKFNIKQNLAGGMGTASFENTVGPNISWIHFGLKGDWYIRSAANDGKIIIQDMPGTVCIGTVTPATGYKLSVNGKVICEEMKVQLHASWPDYVFDKDYALLSTEELEQSIITNKHLPGIPSAAEVEKNGGFHVGEMQQKLLEKVEELTLYIIRQQKQIDELNLRIDKSSK